MAEKWLVYVTHGVYVDTDTPLEPEARESDHVKLRSLAVRKIWEQGIFVLNSEADIEYENVTEEFEEWNTPKEEG
jgi:hypothetical protein